MGSPSGFSFGVMGMDWVGCAQGSASNYRSEYRKRQEAQVSELAAVAGVVNE